MRLLRIEDPALSYDARVPDSRGCCCRVGIVRAPAGEQDRNIGGDAKARTDLVRQVDVFQIDLVHDLCALLHTVSLLYVADKMLIRELVPVTYVQFKIAGLQVASL